MYVLHVKRILFLLFVCSILHLGYSCFSDTTMNSCGCSNKKSSNSKDVYCHRTSEFYKIFQAGIFPDDVISIDLSDNWIKNISSQLFPAAISQLLKSVTSLILAENQISYIGPSTFTNFRNLKRLNLSHNNIGRLDRSMFLGLTSLERLYLNNNIFPLIPGDTFTSLTSLKRLNVSSTHLVCNCMMKEFLVWSKMNRTTKLKLNGACTVPLSMKGINLKRVKIKRLKCDVLSDLPYFDIRPAKQQVVFEGDSISLHCEGTDLFHAKINWSLNGVRISNSSMQMFNQTFRRSYDTSVVSSRLTLPNLTAQYSGVWGCTISSNISFVSKHTEIKVLKTTAKYCDRVNVTNDMGNFTWHEAVTGVTVRYNCTEPQQEITMEPHIASRQCILPGVWSIGNYSQCQFHDPLARYSKMMLERNISRENAWSVCSNAVGNLSGVIVRDSIGFQLLGEVIGNCSEHLQENMISLSSSILELMGKSMSSHAFYSILPSHEVVQTCNKLQRILKTTAIGFLSNMTNINMKSSNIALAGYNFNVTDQKYIYCSISEAIEWTELTKYPELELASQSTLLLPPAVPTAFLNGNSINKLYIAVYKNGNLFQSSTTTTMSLMEYKAWKNHLQSSQQEDKGKIVAKQVDFLADMTKFKQELKKNIKPDPERHVLVSSIYSVHVNNRNVVNLTKPAVYIFHTQESVSQLNLDYEHYIAMWNGSGWNRAHHHCIFNHTTRDQQQHNITVIQCDVLATFAIMKNIQDPNSRGGNNGRQTTLTHPTVYAGSAVLTLTLLLMLITYAVFRNLLLSRDARHMIINTTLHLLVAVLTFTVGVWSISSKVMCYVTGILLHYSSLSVLLWITLSSGNICKEMLAAQQPPLLEPKPSKPMLRFYLIGCGIPIIICGITASAKIENYNGDGGQYCWLSWETSLYAFYAPAACIAIFCILVLLRILATLNCAPSGEMKRKSRKRRKREYSKEFIGEDTPLQYMESSFTQHSNPVNNSFSKDVENEQSSKTRLQGVALILVLFITTWVTAAMTVAAPRIQEQKISSHVRQTLFNQNYFKFFKQEEPTPSIDLHLIFSCIFAMMCIAMSSFLLIQHLTSRSDVRRSWRNLCNRRKKKVLEAESNIQINNDIATNIPDRKRENTVTTAATDPTTTETALHLTTGGESSRGNLTSRHSPFGRNSSAPLPGGTYDTSRASSAHKCAQFHREKALSNTLTESGLLVPHSNSSLLLPSDPNNFYTLTEHQHGDSFHSPSQEWGYHGYGQHYYKSSSKPVKMTNLQQHQLDSSMTEHSFDDSHNNMHTIPVVLQHTQPKIDNKVLYHRYQKMRKALDAKRNRQKKLTVLREYAQDPLTSNDESPTKPQKSIDKSSEQIPLLSNVSKCHNANEDEMGLDNLVNTDNIITLPMPKPADEGEQNYRLLLISSPNKKKGETCMQGKYGQRKRVTGDPNLVSSYRRKSLQQNTVPLEPGGSSRSAKRRRPPASRRRARQRATRHETQIKAAASHTEATASQVEATAPPVTDNVSVKSRMSANQAAAEARSSGWAMHQDKAHNYLTAQDLFSGAMHLPSRKSSSCQAPSNTEPQNPGFQIIDMDDNNVGHENATTSPTEDTDLAYAALRNETSV
nr:adhesion G protein-coupled receptor A3 [Ciona intestinalis]|eukprot:XP_009859246.1 adhesion G protein-coupled receptor A3 [Ciona intestinalis]